MITVGKVSTNIDFQENEVIPLLHVTLQMFDKCLPSVYVKHTANIWKMLKYFTNVQQLFDKHFLLNHLVKCITYLSNVC